ncbi:MAG: hypothetical protein H7147_10385 [Frankiaceae bacterium]|nr:hypothetical protein [Arenimonas sp.]
MKRVLVVSPHFPPVSAADMHRVRMLLPFFERNGWQAEVLAVAPADVDAPLDPMLESGLPSHIKIHRVAALPRFLSKLPGLGTLGLRAMGAIDCEASRLLSGNRFDLVYFSTTAFEIHALGPRWKRRFGVPFVMDYQDAWVSDYYRQNPSVPAPGGRIKYWLASQLHRWMEPRALRDCAGITSVSPDYPRQLTRRYPGLMAAMPVLVQGFPGAPADFERLLPVRAGNGPFDPRDGRNHWVYVGRGGRDMARALRGFFMALRDHASEELLTSLKLHFIGTSYAAAGSGTDSIAPIAAEFGLQHLVHESTDRISYSLTLWCLRHANALIVPGSDDPAYTASKIYPYLLARRPLLAIFHARSTVIELVAATGGAVCVPFNSDDAVETLAGAIAETWLAGKAYEHVTPLDLAAFSPYSDAGCAVEMAAFFDACLASASATKT